MRNYDEIGSNEVKWRPASEKISLWSLRDTRNPRPEENFERRKGFVEYLKPPCNKPMKTGHLSVLLILSCEQRRCDYPYCPLEVKKEVWENIFSRNFLSFAPPLHLSALPLHLFAPLLHLLCSFDWFSVPRSTLASSKFSRFHSPSSLLAKKGCHTSFTHEGFWLAPEISHQILWVCRIWLLGRVVTTLIVILKSWMISWF